jgi:hypothetical protein
MSNSEFKITHIELGISPVTELTYKKLKFDAAMSPKSFILTPDCHPTGGAALYNWFYALQADASMTGSYMITIGGYHQAFTTTTGFPEPMQLHIS